jgi:hypothetical protein
MEKDHFYYIVGILLLIIFISLFFNNYSVIEGFSTIQKIDYKLVEKCNESTDKNLPSYGFYFKKGNFQSIFFSSTSNETINLIKNNIFNSDEIFNIDKCNNVLYSITTNNVIKAFQLDNKFQIKFEKINVKDNSIIQIIKQIIIDSQVKYIIDSKTKELSFKLNNNDFLITFTSMDLDFNILKFENYNIQQIKMNNNTLYDNKNVNDKTQYIYGNLIYDADVTKNIKCLCMNYYPKN